jgi:hypothetical protein
MGKRKSKIAKQKQSRVAAKHPTALKKKALFMGGVTVVKKKARSTLVEELKLPWQDHSHNKVLLLSKAKNAGAAICPPTPKPSSNTTPRSMSATPVSSSMRKQQLKDDDDPVMAAAAANQERREFHQQLASLLERNMVTNARHPKKRNKSRHPKNNKMEMSSSMISLAPATFTWNDDDSTTTTTRLMEETMTKVQSFSIGRSRTPTTTTTTNDHHHPATFLFHPNGGTETTTTTTTQQLPTSSNVLQVLAAQYREQQQQQQQSSFSWTTLPAVSTNTTGVNHNPFGLLESDDDEDANHQKQPFSFAPPSFALPPPMLPPQQPLLSMANLRIGEQGGGTVAFMDGDDDPDL